MFPEFADLISRLKSTDQRFAQMHDRHCALDQRIRDMESHVQPATHEEIEILKKEKLLLKDQIYAQLRKAGAAAGRAN